MKPTVCLIQLLLNVLVIKCVNCINQLKGVIVVVVKADWIYGGKSGVRLDAYFIRKLEPVIRINDALKRMCGGEEEEEVVVLQPKKLLKKK